MFSRPFLALSFLSLILIAGCQPLPQPFQPDSSRKIANPLLKLPDGNGVVVVPVAGMAPEAAQVLARRMADALIAEQIPASVGTGNAASLRLDGRMFATLTAPGREDIRLFWTVRDDSGSTVGDVAVSHTITHSGQEKISPEILDAIAGKSARAVAALIQEPAPIDQTTQLSSRALYVASVDGAPNAAASLLRAELVSALRQLDLRVVPELGDDSILVAGAASREPAGRGSLRLSLDWTIMRPDGKSLGKLAQSNTVEASALESQWPAIARAIAIATARGVRDLLDKTPESALMDPGTEDGGHSGG